MRLTVWISVWLNQHFVSLHLFNVLYAVCVYFLTRCSMLVLPYCRYCIDLLSDNWCPFSTHLSVEITLVCSTRAPLVEPCHTFCVPKHLSALCEKMLVFLQSLPWVLRGGKHREWMVPSAYFPFLVSVLHLMSLPQAWYINCISIIFFLSELHVCHIFGEDNNTYLLSTFKPILRYIKCQKYYNKLHGSKFWKWHWQSFGKNDIFFLLFLGWVTIWAWERQRF